MRLLTLTHSIGLAATLLATASLQAQTNHRGESFPQQNLPRTGRSQEIPSLLGAKLDQVAAWYDRSSADLVKLFTELRGSSRVAAIVALSAYQVYQWHYRMTSAGYWLYRKFLPHAKWAYPEEWLSRTSFRLPQTEPVESPA